MGQVRGGGLRQGKREGAVVGLSSGGTAAPVMRLVNTLDSTTVTVLSAGMPKPVQRLAGQAATGPEQDLPFVLDDDAVAPVYDRRLQEQQQAANSQDAAAQMHSLRPHGCYGHRSPASALAGWCPFAVPLCCCPVVD